MTDQRPPAPNAHQGRVLAPFVDPPRDKPANPDVDPGASTKAYAPVERPGTPKNSKTNYASGVKGEYV